MTEISTLKENPLFQGDFKAYTLHNYSVEPSQTFETLAESTKCIQAIKHKQKNIYGVLFHPEVRNQEILKRFIQLESVTIVQLRFSCECTISHDAPMTANEPSRIQIKPGIRVKIVLKQDQRSGKLTEGTVKELLTSSPTHPHGIKVRLTDGKVGRVQSIM